MRKIVAVFISFLILLTGCSGDNQGETIAKAFLDNIKKENYIEAAEFCTVSANEIETGLKGINIIDYSEKSVRQETAVHEISILNSGNDDFENLKETNKNAYPDYEVVVDNEVQLIMNSNDPVLDRYVIVYDVQYSNASGDVKRNSVTISVTQTSPGSNVYKVTECIGFVNS